MATEVQLTALLTVRTHPSGAVYVAPVADPRLVIRALDAGLGIDAMERFLGRHLANLRADVLSEFVYPEATEAKIVEVVVPRVDLPRRIRITQPVAVACAVVPDREIQWVHVLPLAHTVHVRPDEPLERKVVGEIGRLVGARELTGAEYLALLPPRTTELVAGEVTVSRKDVADLGVRAAKRREKSQQRKLEAARKLLAEVGERLLGRQERAEAAKKRKEKRAEEERRGKVRRDGDAPPSKERPPPPPVIGRDDEIRRLRALLEGTERLSVIVVGDEMAGKSAVVHGLVEAGLSRPLYVTSGSQLVAGQSGFGMLEDRIQAVMRAVELLDAVLYFDDLGDLFSGHSGGIEDMASAMRSFIIESKVRVIGELTPELAELYEKRHVGFFAGMHRLRVEPLDLDQTRSLLHARVEHAHTHEPQRPTLEDAAIDPLVELADRYETYRAFPGKAVRLYEELRAIHEGELRSDGSVAHIGPHQVYAAFSVRSGIPTFLLREDERMKHAEVVAFFRDRLIGQDDAITRVASTLCTVKARLQPPAKPLANFLFVGPTGVGKTEVAKTLARFLFGGPERLIRFDMSEYMDPLAADRLIRGGASGDGELTKRVRQQPFCVVLLDEIEKAHPAVFDLLLQVCGEGRLSDARGRTTHFHNALIIMTSNLGAAHRKASRSGFGDDTATDERQYYLERVDAHFRPEFVNRIDRVIPFRALTAAEGGQVARVALQRIIEREGLVHRNVDLRVSDAALQRLAEEGYSAIYGARALRRHLEDRLVAPVATTLAAMGRAGEAAEIRVVADGEAEDTDGAVEGRPWRTDDRELAEGGSRIVVHAFERPRADARNVLGVLQQVSALRRTAAVCLQAPVLADMRERVETLVAELATVASPDPRRKRPPEGIVVAQLGTEHARLSRLLAGPDEELEQLEGAEDLALSALYEGVPPDEYATLAQEAFGRFEVAFVRTVLGATERDSACLVLQPQDDPESIRRWLVPLLASSRDRGWQCSVHQWRVPAGDENPEWPRDCPWGPPRAAQWARDALEKATEQELRTKWRCVLLRITGPNAGSIMLFEAGLQRWEGAQEPMHLRIQWVYSQFNPSIALLSKPPFAPSERLGKRELSAKTPVRTFNANGAVWVPAASTEFPEAVVAHYWAEVEHVLFGIVAPLVARGEEFLSMATDEDGEDA